MKESNDTERMRIIERRQHPEFNSTTFSNNFMVLKLDQAVDTLPRVILQEYDEIPEGSKLAVVGFGSTAARIEISKIDSEVFQHNVIDTSEILRYGNDDGPVIHMNDAILQKEEVALVPFEECNADDQFAGFIDNNTMICAGNLDDGGDNCKSDGEISFHCCREMTSNIHILTQALVTVAVPCA
jgi:secreted trypsin-like serine protease